MRKGMNPLRHKPMPPAPPIVAAVITHLPDMTGYHEYRLPVVQTSLLSLAQTAPDLPVMVWDNGSCDELRGWLVGTYRPHTLVLSENVGKTSARAALFRMLPEDTLIAMADDDMYYCPGWIEKHMEIIEAYPPALVSGLPTRHSFGWGNTNTLLWAEVNARIERGTFIPDGWEEQYALSTGKAKPAKQKDEAMLTYRGVRAFATAHHCQFVARVGDVLPMTKFVRQYTTPEIEFDNAVDAAGILRLATIERTTRHMGNILDPDLRKEVRRNHYPIWEPAYVS